MVILLPLGILLSLLTASISLHMPLYWALLLGLVPFIFLAHSQGSSFTEIKKALWQGFLKPKKVYTIMLLIGFAKPLWIACGATAYLTQLGIEFIRPHSFLLVVFLFTFFTTLLLGSAIGTTGLIGVTFMNISSFGHVNPAMTAGAILSAIYLGERASPLSSCANLVSEVSQIPLFVYIKENLLNRWKSLVFILVAYALLSYLNPLQMTSLNTSGTKFFDPSTLLLLSPFLVMVLYLFIRKNILYALALSGMTGFIIALLYKAISPLTLLSLILSEGGLIGMFKASLVLMSAALLTGLFEGTTLMFGIQNLLLKYLKNSRFKLIFVSSLIGSIVGCSQTFAVLFATQMVKPLYKDTPEDRVQLACDLSNTSVLMPSWIPWNVAYSIPVTLLMVDYKMVFWAFAVTFLPLVSLFQTFNFNRLSLKNSPTNL